MLIILQKVESSHHPTYPHPIQCFLKSIETELKSLPSTIGRVINDQADLDLLYFEPYIPKYLEREVFQFLRKELFFYRVEYKIKRGGIETDIRTPRYAYVSPQSNDTKLQPDTPRSLALMTPPNLMKLEK